MAEQEEKKVVPEHKKGISTDTESSVTFDDAEDARKHFQTVKNRLFNVSQWKEISDAGPSAFRLIDSTGNEITRTARKGDYFKIDIPGPGTDSGEGYDWVYIYETGEEDDPARQFELADLKVHPAPNPQKADKDVSHFFDEQASSTFLVKREGNKITASVHGRNESPNTGTEDLTDKIRNAVIALGALVGLSKFQWKSLTEGLVKK